MSTLLKKWMIGLVSMGTWSGLAMADEGLWTIDHVPIQRIQASYGLNLSNGWIDHVRDSAIRLSSSYGGCSASLVSAQGLVLTNNHCIAECAQDNSEAGHDRYTEGYVADDRSHEKRCKKLTAEVIESITDVTSSVVSPSTGSSTGSSVTRDDIIDRLQASACAGTHGVRCVVAEFYRGAQYKLIRYRTYDDVRLVFSAGAAASLLEGGRFPGLGFDVAFLRVYRDGKPASTPRHLGWNAMAPHDGDITVLMGSPRFSERQLTVSQLKTERDFLLPNEQIRNAELIGRLTRFGKESSANRDASQFQLWDLKNHQGYTFDLTATLRDETLFAKKIDEEANLRAQGGSAVEAQLAIVAEAERARREQSLPHEYLVEPPQSELMKFARLLVRAAIERSKPDSTRNPDYKDAQLPAREQQLLTDRPAFQPLEELQLAFWFAMADRDLDADDPVKTLLLDGTTPDALAERLSHSKLGDVTLRRQLWTGGLKAIQASDDPMIRYVFRIEPEAAILRAKWDKTVIAPEEAAAPVIAAARFKLGGTQVYPDANRTLRLSFGRIAGYEDKGKTYKPFTTLGDFNQYVDTHGDTGIDKRWLQARHSLSAGTALRMSTSNDGINGNSGSPILNAKGEVVGLFTGGNDAAMGGNYLYDPEHNRAVAVSAEAIYEVLNKVYAAKDLASELVKQKN